MGRWTKTTKISAESNGHRRTLWLHCLPSLGLYLQRGTCKARQSDPSRPSDIIVSVRHRIHNFLLLLPPRLLSRISSSHRTISRSNSISLSVPCLALPCLPLSCSPATSLLGCQGWWVVEMLLLLLLSQFPCFYKMRCSACTSLLNVYPNTNVIAVLLLPPQVLYCAKFCFWAQ